MIWLPMAGHGLTGHKDYSANKNIFVNYFHVLTCVGFKCMMYFNMVGS